MLAIFIVGSFLFALQQLLEYMLDHKLGTSLRNHGEIFFVGSVIDYLHHHLGVASPGESPILHMVDPRAVELLQRRGTLRVPFLKLPSHLVGPQKAFLNRMVTASRRRLLTCGCNAAGQ